MKSIAITAAALAALALAAPAGAAGYGGGHTVITVDYYTAYGDEYAYRRPDGFPPFGALYGWYYFGQPSGAYRWYGYGYHAAPAARVVSVRAVIHALRTCHYRHVRHVRLKGRVYHALARDPYGRPVRLEIDAYSGAVIGVRYDY